MRSCGIIHSYLMDLLLIFDLLCIILFYGNKKLNEDNALCVCIGIESNAQNDLSPKWTKNSSTKPPYDEKEPKYDHKEDNIP